MFLLEIYTNLIHVCESLIYLQLDTKYMKSSPIKFEMIFRGEKYVLLFGGE